MHNFQTTQLIPIQSLVILNIEFFFVILHKFCARVTLFLNEEVRNFRNGWGRYIKHLVLHFCKFILRENWVYINTTLKDVGKTLQI